MNLVSAVKAVRWIDCGLDTPAYNQYFSSSSKLYWLWDMLFDVQRVVHDKLYTYSNMCMGYMVVQWLRHCATYQKVAGSIPNGVGIFHWHILPAALWPWGWLNLKQKCVSGIFSGGKGGQCLGLTTLPPSYANCLKMWEPQPPGTLRACQGL
jgi:hypothetical protein